MVVVGFNAYEVEFREGHAALRAQAVGISSHHRNFTLEYSALKAIRVIQMDMHRCDNEVVVFVRDRRQALCE